jgi:DNA-binding NarL/FixJ family response regulator
VDTYRASILRKLGVESVIELVKFAMNRKLS